MKSDGTLTAIQMRGLSGMGPYRKGQAIFRASKCIMCQRGAIDLVTVYTNKAVSANYRAPAYPQGCFALESVMDDVATKLKMDPLEFRLKNMTRKFREQIPYTSSGLEECMRRGAEAFEWKKRWREANSDPGPVKRGVGMAMGMFPSRWAAARR